MDKANSEQKSIAEEDIAQISTSPNDQTLAEQIAKHQHEMYLKSQEQEQKIDEEVRETQLLVSPKQDIMTLAQAYDAETSTEYYLKAIDLSEHYSHIRRIRGDGNCFYRAVLTAVLERCCMNKSELERVSAICKSWRPKLFAYGFPEFTTSDFCESMETVLESINNGTKTMEFLFDDLTQDGIANYYVAFIRLITSGYLRENEADFAGFIEGGRTMDQYCKEEVEPMWRECDHMCIIALVNALQVPIRVEYMDRSQAPNGGWHHDFSVGDFNQPPQYYFLYRPGHYDILYRR